MTPIETGSGCSIGLPVARSQPARRPDGQLLTCRRKGVRSPASSVRSTWVQTPPFVSQKRAPAHSDSASVSARVGPSTTFACSRYVVRRAVSVPSKPILLWVPSQNGLALDLPHLQSWYESCAGNASPSRHCCDPPSLSVTMVCLASGTPPLTRWGPLLEMTPRGCDLDFVIKGLLPASRKPEPSPRVRQECGGG